MYIGVPARKERTCKQEQKYKLIMAEALPEFNEYSDEFSERETGENPCLPSLSVETQSA